MQQQPRAERPLEGIKVVEVGVWHAGPGAGAILGDLGAEVVKVEGIEGEPERFAGRFGPLKTDELDREGWTVLYDMSNRNKRGISIDLRSERGREVLARLVAEADVFLTNLRTPSKSRLGIDYATLSAINPRLVHVNVTGFGSEGPMADDGAFDTLGQAMSGMMYLAGTEPAPISVIVLDQLASIVASHAAVTALYERERSGVGQDVHTSLLGSAIWLMHANLMATSAMRKDVEVAWVRDENSPVRNTFRCGDGRWIVGTNHPEPVTWPKLCAAVGRSDLVLDARFDSKEKRDATFAEALRELDATFLERDADHWLERLTAAGLFFAPVRTFSEVLVDPQARANGYIVDFEHPVLGELAVPNYPIVFGAQKAGVRAAAPLEIGQHTDEILDGAGFSMDEVQRLRADGVLR